MSEAQTALVTPPTQIEPTRVEIDPNSTQAQPPQPEPVKDANRPQWLPPKFKSPEDLAKAYGELEKRLGGKAPESTKQADPPADPSKAADLKINEAEKQAEAKGIDLKAYEDEFAQSQSLSEKSYEALAKAGIPKEMVDTYIQGRQALMERSAEATLKSVGLDMDSYQKMGQWAAQNVPKAELEAYNRIVTGTDEAAAKIALSGLQARFKAAQEPDFFKSGETPDTRGDVFRSTAELTKAMADPRYRNDPAYRDDVAQKLNRSNIL